jgi:predicted dithiol-disulfide oxidoreductase (DUF899 family)
VTFQDRVSKLGRHFASSRCGSGTIVRCGRESRQPYFLAASADLLAREKELSRMGDELARLRRELPWVPVEKQYTLQTAGGRCSRC